jgi:hypothetical protein
MTDVNVISQFYSHKLEQEASVPYQGVNGKVPASPIALPWQKRRWSGWKPFLVGFPTEPSGNTPI